MRLRQRLGIAFAVTNCGAVLLAFAVTWLIFRHGQQRGLDDALLVRARAEAKAVQRAGAATLDPPTPLRFEEDDDIDHLVTFAALYSRDGALIHGTPTFRGRAPTLQSIGWRPGVAMPLVGFDFPGPDGTLRGVLVRVGPRPAIEGLLLFAAPRGDMEADTRDLIEVMGLVLTGSVAMAILLGVWLGGRTARGVEAIAAVAREVARGELAARVPPAVGPEREVQALGGDLNAMIDRLHSVIEAQRRFISYAAHELRSPLAALRGELELALRHPRSEGGYRAAIAEALEDTNRLVDLAEELLGLARLEAGPVTRSGIANLQATVKEAVRQSRGRSEITREIDSAVADLMVAGDGADLARMLRNLIDNAVAHAPPGGAVRIRSRIVGEGVEVRVEDDGPGVPAELRERVFEPFFRGDSERERSGAGLGLAIARAIARAHGGDLRIDADAPTSCFVATLPLAAAAASTADQT